MIAVEQWAKCGCYVKAAYVNGEVIVTRRDYCPSHDPLSSPKRTQEVFAK